MNLLRLAGKALRMPPGALVGKVRLRLARWRAARSARARDLRCGTWEPGPGPLTCHWRLSGAITPQRTPEELAALAEVSRRHLEHRYDLLGSGWIAWVHGADCPGLLGHRFAPGPAVGADREGRWLAGRVPDACLADSQAIWRLVTAGYQPHDWQLDARSGFRWSATTWYRDVRYGAVRGADVKLPWELARMQHLPSLAQARAHAQRGAAGGWADAERYADEVQDQILDFCAANPPRFGVNWACAMDVAIRVANWLLALDTLQAEGGRLRPGVLEVVAGAVRQHGRFIATHLEWDEVARGNHYLTDLAGLAWAGAWLPSDAETDGWLALAWRELLAEVPRLFQADGSYGEASTAYHCLATEIAIYATVAIAGLPAERRAALPTRAPAAHPAPQRPPPPPLGSGALFPDAHWLALARAAAAIPDFTRPDGGLALIGDDDSGRFCAWSPPYRLRSGQEAHAEFLDLDPRIDPPGSPFPESVHRDKRAIAGAALAWSHDPALREWTGRPGGAECALVAALGRDGLPAPVPRQPPGGGPPVEPGAEAEWCARWRATPPALRRERRFSAPAGRPLGEGLILRSYPEFGLWIWRSPRLVLLIRCGSGALPGLAGHAHEDQLACELHIDGAPLICDPGAFTYTPLPDLRRRYRGWEAHGTFPPARGEGQGQGGSLFAQVSASARCLLAGAASFLGVLDPPGAARRVDILADAVIIRDAAGIPAGAPMSEAAASAYGRRLRRPGSVHASARHPTES